MKKNMLLVMFTIFTGLICLWTGDAIGTEDTEVIFGAEVSQHSVRFKVLSNGCTDDQSFSLTLTEPALITLVRLVPDQCRRRSHHIWIETERPSALTGDVVSISNRWGIN